MFQEIGPKSGSQKWNDSTSQMSDMPPKCRRSMFFLPVAKKSIRMPRPMKNVRTPNAMGRYSPMKRLQKV